MSDSLQSHGLQHASLPCPLPTPRPCSNSCPSCQTCIALHNRRSWVNSCIPTLISLSQTVHCCPSHPVYLRISLVSFSSFPFFKIIFPLRLMILTQGSTYNNPETSPLKELFLSFFLYFFNNFIYFWLHWTFVAVQGLSLVVVLRLLTVVASLVAELRL